MTTTPHEYMKYYNEKPKVTFEQQRTLDFLKKTLTSKPFSEKINYGLPTKKKLAR